MESSSSNEKKNIERVEEEDEGQDLIEGSTAGNPEDGTNNALQEDTKKDLDSAAQLENVAQKVIGDCFSLCEDVLNPAKEAMQGTNGEILIGQFTEEIERLLKVLGGLQEQSQKLAVHNEKLNVEFKEHYATKKAARNHLAEDEVFIKHLKNQIKKNADTVDASQRRQKAYKEEARKISAETTALQVSIRQGVTLNAVQERRLNELTVAKEQAQESLDAHLGQLNRLREQVTSIAEQIRGTDEEGRELEKEAFRVKEQLVAKKLEIDDSNRSKDKLDQELKEIRDVISSKMNDYKQKQDQINRATEEIGRIESTIKTRKTKLETMIKDQDIIVARADKLKEESLLQNKKSNELAHSNSSTAKELYMKEADLNKARVEIKKMNKFREQLQGKIRQLEDQRIEAESERQTLKVQNDALQKQISDTKRHVEFYRKEVEDLNRELGMVSSDVSKAEDAISEDKLVEQALRKARYNMEADIQRNQREAASVGSFVNDLRHERDKYISEAEKLQLQQTKLTAELKQKEIDLFEFKKKLVQTEAKLKHQQNLYEAVQSDRSLHSKQLLAAQFEVAGMKRQLKTMTYQIAAYKEDIASKEDSIKREVNELEKLISEIKVINDDIVSVDGQKDLAQSYIRTQVTEESKLNQFVKEAIKERARQEHALSAVRLELNQLSAQRTKQDAEISLISGRLKTKRHSLLRGERQYCLKLAEVQEKRAELRKLKQKRFELERQMGSLADVRSERVKLQERLLLETIRLGAMKNEAKNKINVHRWRKLESKNPKAFELIQTVHLLQKKLIQKNLQIQAKSNQIRQTEETYLQLRKVLSRQAGPEAVEQIGELEKIAKDKAAQHKHMGTELNMYRQQVEEYRHAISELDNELDGFTGVFRKKYRSQQKRQRELERQQRVKEVLRAKYNEGAGKDIVMSSDDEMVKETPPSELDKAIVTE